MSNISLRELAKGKVLCTGVRLKADFILQAGGIALLHLDEHRIHEMYIFVNQ